MKPSVRNHGLLFLLLVVFYAVYLFTEGTIYGRVFEDRYPHNINMTEVFKTTKSKRTAKLLHQAMTFMTRTINSTGYINTLDVIKSHVDDIELMTNGINVDSPIFPEPEISNVTTYMKSGTIQTIYNVHNHLVKLYPGNSTTIKQAKGNLLIAAHIDGHNVGQSAYDDAINVVAMAEVIRLLLAKGSNSTLKSNVSFLFDGSEEFGLHGAHSFVQAHPEYYNYFNLEAMGNGRPFALLTKGLKSTSTIKTFSKIKGAMIGTFCNDIFNSGIIKSGSDASVFDSAGYTGAQAVFVGHPSFYHTFYDQIKDNEDLNYLVSLLYNFVINYEAAPEEVDTIGYGIHPFIFTISKSKMRIISIVIAILCLFPLHKCTSFKHVLKGILVLVSVFSIYIIFGFLIFYFNSSSYASHPRIFALLFVTSGVILVLLISQKFVIQNWEFTRLLIDSLLLLAANNLDTALPLTLCIIWQPLYPYLKAKVQSSFFVIAFLQLLSMSFFFCLLVPTFFNYTSMLPGIMADLVSIGLIAVYSLHVAMPIVYFMKGKTVSYKLILIPIFTAVLLLLKPYPYGPNYICKGSFSHIFDTEKLKTTMAFAPDTGMRAIPYLKRFGQTVDLNWSRPLWNGPAIIKEGVDVAQLPPKVKLPEFSLNPMGYGYVVFETTYSPKSFYAAHLLIKCPNGTACVQEIEGVPKIAYFMERPDTVAFNLRNTDGNLKHSILMNSTVADFEICYSTDIENPEFAEFKKSFGPWVQHSQRERFIHDTVVVFRKNGFHIKQ